TIDETIRFAEELDPFSIQVSIAAPYPGTELYRQATENGWMDSSVLVSLNGVQTSTLRYPHLSPDDIEEAVERMYRSFYFRQKPIFRFLREMAADRQMLVRRLREGREFFGYLKERRAIVRGREEQTEPEAAALQ
ncbi:MAG: hopanoid biosynthesis associated radical SAM protein HpnJ, partial [Bryobacteraceae bacterium]